MNITAFHENYCTNIEQTNRFYISVRLRRSVNTIYCTQPNGCLCLCLYSVKEFSFVSELSYFIYITGSWGHGIFLITSFLQLI